MYATSRATVDFKPSLNLNASTISLILVNLFTIGVAIWQSWNAGEIILLYYIQSLIIGVFQFFKILDVEKFSVEGVTINGSPAEQTASTKYFFAGFFVVHYGLFHFVYLCFIITFLSTGLIKLAFTPYFLLAIFLLITNHLFSYVLNRKADKKREVNIGRMFMLPYARIIPMHLILILMGILSSFGGGNITILVIFMLIKTLADVVTHNMEHRLKNTFQGN